MTDKELKKMSRGDLLEILVAQSEELDRLRALLAESEQKLQDRSIGLNKAGSIAEAALGLNGVFEAADAAAKQYLESVKSHCDAERERLALIDQQLQQEADERSRALENQAAALNRDRKYLANFKLRLEQRCGNSPELRRLVAEVIKDLREAGVK